MMNSLTPIPPKPSGSLGFPTMSPQATPPIMAPGQMPTATPAAPAPLPTENVPASVIPAPGAQPGGPPHQHWQGDPKDGPGGMHIPGRMDRLGIGDMLRQYLSSGGDMGAFKHGMQDVRHDWLGGGRGDNQPGPGGSGLIDMLRQKLGIASAPPVAGNTGIVPPAPAVPAAIPPIIGS